MKRTRRIRIRRIRIRRRKRTSCPTLAPPSAATMMAMMYSATRRTMTTAETRGCNSRVASAEPRERKPERVVSHFR